MGIYVINRDVMIKLLKEYFPKANDLTSEVIPGAISLGMKVRSCIFIIILSYYYYHCKPRVPEEVGIKKAIFFWAGGGGAKTEVN